MGGQGFTVHVLVTFLTPVLEYLTITAEGKKGSFWLTVASHLGSFWHHKSRVMGTSWWRQQEETDRDIVSNQEAETDER